MDTILLVEDNPDDIFFVKRAFKANAISHPLQVVEDGQTAIDYLSGAGPFGDRQKHPLPSLILIDLKLPQRPGLEVLAWIHGQPQLQHVIVIVLTSSHLPVDIERAYALGAHSFLVKPPNSRQLTELIALIERYWLKYNRPPPPSRPSTGPSSRP